MKEKNRVVLSILSVIATIVVIVVLILIENIKVMGNNDSLAIKEVQALVKPDDWDTTKVTKYVDSEKNVAPIPKGYVVSKVEGEDLIRTGLVIYEGDKDVTGDTVGEYGSAAWNESCSRNQWVWVPCSDPSRIYEDDSATMKKKGKLYSYTDTGRTVETKGDYKEPEALAFAKHDNEEDLLRYNKALGLTKDKLNDEQESKYEATIDSIKKYGGFYIGRYETGNLNKSKPVVRRMNTDVKGITWYEMYDKIGYLSANENVKSNIIWGSLWDETLQWIVESEAKDSNGNIIGYKGMKDSISWGNYSESAFYYINENGKTVYKSSTEEKSVPTGSTEYTKANNIYDMAGNMDEWTLESYGTGRATHGGSYAKYYGTNLNELASWRFHYDPGGYNTLGVRAFFYIK